MRIPRTTRRNLIVLGVASSVALATAATAVAWPSTQQLVKINVACVNGTNTTTITASYTNTDTSPMTVYATLDGGQPTAPQTIFPGETFTPTFNVTGDYAGGKVVFHLAWAKKPSSTDTKTVTVPATSAQCQTPATITVPGPSTVQTVTVTTPGTTNTVVRTVQGKKGPLVSVYCGVKPKLRGTLRGYGAKHGIIWNRTGPCKVIVKTPSAPTTT